MTIHSANGVASRGSIVEISAPLQMDNVFFSLLKHSQKEE
jgi:hypothetical protein